MLNALRFKGEPAFEGALAGALIQRNATGMAVRKLQRSLMTLGFPIPAGATGFFGDQTVQAVGDYQTSRGLSRDGQVGHDTMTALDNDFAAELRPFPGWFLSSPGLGTQTDGNAVKVYVGGDEAFPDIAAALLLVAPGDFVYLAGWHLELDCALDALPDGTGDPTMTPRTLLQLASDNGAEVRVLLAKNPTAGSGGAFGTYDNRPAVAFVNGLANGAAVEDDRVLEAGTHHQKIIVVKSGNGLTAFAGGMDLFHDRVSWGNPGAAPLHDVHLRITGPAASSLRRNFIRRWTDSPTASVLAPLVATVPAPGALGSVQCQTAFTFGNGTTHGGGFDPGTGYAFAPNGERSLKSLVLHAIGSARQFIYVEDQYLVDPDISQALAAAAPNVSSIIILIQNTVHVNQELGDLGQYWARRKTFLTPVLSAANNATACVHNVRYVHSKTWIFDDELAIVGSANVNRRGMTHDSEHAVALHDPAYGFVVKDLRTKLWSRHLNRPETELSESFPGSQLWFGDLSGTNVSRYDPNGGSDPGPASDPFWNNFGDPDGT